MFFKIPALNSNGHLSQEDGQTIYEHYLTSERTDYDGVKRKPTKQGIVNAMKIATDNHNLGIIQDYFDQGKNVYFWSDTHFSHQNIIKYSNRPFEDKSHMNNVMLKNYFSTVKNEDLVVWGGDVSFGPVQDTTAMLANLPGKKVLILGNHDFDKNHLKFRNYHVFDNNFMSNVFHLEIKGRICNLLITHYPVDNNLLPSNTLNIHGHIHTYLADKKNINISVEHTGYKPVLLQEIIEKKFLTYC